VTEQAIRALVHRYADAASRRDPDGVADTFTSDGEWYSPELGGFTGRGAMLSFFTSMLDGWTAFLQGLQSGVLTESGPEFARGRWFVHEYGQRADGTSLSIAGVYHDEYRCVDGRWLIARRRYDPLLRDVNGTVTAHPYPDITA
jgi:ketosteroid isomerase-like protein